MYGYDLPLDVGDATFMLVLTTRRHLASYSDETLVSSLDEFYRNYELITSSILNKSQGLRT